MELRAEIRAEPRAELRAEPRAELRAEQRGKIATDEFCDCRFLRPMKIQPTKIRLTKIRLTNIATTSLFIAIDREIKELLPYSIFIITRRYKRVEI